MPEDKGPDVVSTRSRSAELRMILAEAYEKIDNKEIKTRTWNAVVKKIRLNGASADLLKLSKGKLREWCQSRFLRGIVQELYTCKLSDKKQEILDDIREFTQDKQRLTQDEIGDLRSMLYKKYGNTPDGRRLVFPEKIYNLMNNTLKRDYGHLIVQQQVLSVPFPVCLSKPPPSTVVPERIPTPVWPDKLIPSTISDAPVPDQSSSFYDPATPLDSFIYE